MLPKSYQTATDPQILG